ncbi:MAG: hypothetical protein ACYC4Q_04345 [Victivallaceae bacterium]
MKKNNIQLQEGLSLSQFFARLTIERDYTYIKAYRLSVTPL